MKTLTDLKIEFLTHLRSLNYSGWTVKGYTYGLSGFIKWLNMYGINTASELRENVLDRYPEYLNTLKRKDGFPLKAQTINKNIEFSKVFLRYLAKKHYISPKLSDCLDYLKVPVLLPGTVLDHSEIKEIIKRIPTGTPVDCRDRTVLELLYSTGIRAGELIGLDIDDINLEEKTAKVLGKGNKERLVPVGKTALHYLETYIKAVRPFFPVPRKNDDRRALLLSLKGNRISHAVLSDIIKKHSKSSGKHVTAHVFRRSCTTELIRSGANLYHVKELLGHESLVTLKHYVKLTINDLKKTHAKHHPREKDS